MSGEGGDLRSSGPPEPGPGDHIRCDGGLLVIKYGDYECPYCGAAYPITAAEMLDTIGAFEALVASATSGRPIDC